MATVILPPPTVNGTTPHPAPDLAAQRMTITPQMAADLLKNRPPNRPISKARVRTMIEDMRAGRWVENGETIILDWARSTRVRGAPERTPWQQRAFPGAGKCAP